jgi:hypothetical protein
LHKLTEACGRDASLPSALLKAIVPSVRHVAAGYRRYENFKCLFLKRGPAEGMRALGMLYNSVPNPRLFPRLNAMASVRSEVFYHTKFLTRRFVVTKQQQQQQSSSYGFCVLGSHNLSSAAWGPFCLNYELSVVLLFAAPSTPSSASAAAAVASSSSSSSSSTKAYDDYDEDEEEDGGGAAQLVLLPHNLQCPVMPRSVQLDSLALPLDIRDSSHAYAADDEPAHSEAVQQIAAVQATQSVESFMIQQSMMPPQRQKPRQPQQQVAPRRGSDAPAVAAAAAAAVRTSIDLTGSSDSTSSGSVSSKKRKFANDDESAAAAAAAKRQRTAAETKNDAKDEDSSAVVSLLVSDYHGTAASPYNFEIALALRVPAAAAAAGSAPVTLGREHFERAFKRKFPGAEHAVPHALKSISRKHLRITQLASSALAFKLELVAPLCQTKLKKKKKQQQQQSGDSALSKSLTIGYDDSFYLFGEQQRFECSFVI